MWVSISRRILPSSCGAAAVAQAFRVTAERPLPGAGKVPKGYPLLWRVSGDLVTARIRPLRDQASGSCYASVVVGASLLVQLP